MAWSLLPNNLVIYLGNVISQSNLIDRPAYMDVLSELIPLGRQLDRTPPVLDLRRSLLLNTIPSGRQLDRTPPVSNVVRNLSFDESRDVLSFCETMAPAGRDAPALNMTYDSVEKEYSTASPVLTANESCVDPNSVIKGMTGYQWTQADLEFIKRTQKEKQLKQLEAELEEVTRLLKKATVARDLSRASKEKTQADLNKILPLPCERVLQLGGEFLSRTRSCGVEETPDSWSLLAQIKAADVQRVLREERGAVARLEERLDEALELRAKEETKKVIQRIAERRENIHRLMRELPNLQSKLTETEETLEAVKAQQILEAEAVARKTKSAKTPAQKASTGRKQAAGLATEGAVRRSRRIAGKPAE